MRRRKGFTLVEMLVAIAAVAIIAVGLANVFESASNTIASGQRLSRFMAKRNLIERQMRADFAEMSRSGYLVIRNEWAFNRTPIERFAGDPNPRRVRTDELMFFAEGNFTTARPAWDSDFVASANAARIYYGHGAKVAEPAMYDPTDPYYEPLLSDQNLTALPLGDPTTDNPNRYAADWTLLRHVTVLASPNSTQTEQPGGLLAGEPYARTLDEDRQIAGQPAASSVFRTLAFLYPDLGAGVIGNTVLRDFQLKPQIGSGIVDIATTDLTEIQQILMSARVAPWDVTDVPSFNDTNPGGEGPNSVMQRLSPPYDLTEIERIHGWMLDGLPAFSYGATVNDRYRMRYEDGPTDFYNVIKDTGLSEFERTYRLADHQMLSASNFLPSCTEFIVEWSFGNVVTSSGANQGKLIWHGLDRRVDTDSDGVVDTSFVGRYDDNNQDAAYFRSFIARDGEEYLYKYVTGTSSNDEPFPNELIHPLPAGGVLPRPDDPLVSCFGVLDPTYDPNWPGIDGIPGWVDPDGTTGPLPPYNDDPGSDSMYWPWPKLIRITVTLADPVDPSIEQTFNFVFETPGTPVR